MGASMNQVARLAATTSALAIGLGVGSAMAQDAVVAQEPVAEDQAGSAEPGEPGVIIVTAQRQAQSLQDVPVAVSALTGEALEARQIENPIDLQLALPNVSFTKTNFTTSSFTIRGIGDLCTGPTCDQATAIHLDGTPLLQTRLFETEFFDLERLEVLRGPQGTLFGRNATSGVVNFIPARPNLRRFEAAFEAEYGNYDALEFKGMVNLPLNDQFGVRLAGIVQDRKGYTRNLFDGSRIDDRGNFAVRASLRFTPTDSTMIDLLASYSREDDNRLRIQKQLCQRDPTGVLGCLNARREFGTVNANGTIFSTLVSRELFAVLGVPPALGLTSVYGTDAFASAVNPRDLRQVVTDFRPTYFSDEEQYQARLEQDLGSLKLQVTGFYHKARVDSREDYTLAVQNRAVYAPGLAALAGLAASAAPAARYFAPVAAALIPAGPAGPLCSSRPVESGTGVFGGRTLCTGTPQDADRSYQTSSDWSLEAILASDFDGRFNFLLGGIYVDEDLTDNSYYVSAFPFDYFSGVVGAGLAARAGLPPSYLATPFFRNHTDHFALKSYGIFGEAYYDLNDRLKLTLGARFNHDRKTNRARSTLLDFLAPYGTRDAFDSPFVGSFDADKQRPGNQLFQLREAKFNEWTGRTVLEYQASDDNLLYVSYSRGYKSGGINPPLQPIFAVPDSFQPELIDAFEIGSKNVFADGKLTLNLTGFFYNYKQLQLSRIVARTSVNDNVDAQVYGIEAEALVRPTRQFVVNLSASYLHSRVSEDRLLVNPRDPGGGRSDAVIIKDIINGANCAVVPNLAGQAALANGFVAGANQAINAGRVPGLAPGAGLRAPAPFPTGGAIASTGAFSVCQALQGLQAASAAPVTVLSEGVPVNIRGNKLPQAPTWKFAAGAQYTHAFAKGWTLVPRVDLAYTGEQQSSIFGGKINEIEGFVQVNAQVQLNAPDDRWFVRGFVQNLFDSNATTGLFVSDASTGLFTNLFTLEPRRYGMGAGLRF